MYTREEYEALRRESAVEMAANRDLKARAVCLLRDAQEYNWIQQTTWFGEPALQLPQDMFAFQEIIFKARPKVIVEVGVAWGGAVLFYSTLMSCLGGGKIIGVDIYIPDDLRERLGTFGKLSDRIELIEGSSTDPDTVARVQKAIGSDDHVMVNLDSNHTHDHVLQELRIYSEFVGPGQYLICSDTAVEDIEVPTHRERPWGKGNNPRTALTVFLAENDRFEVDEQIDNKLLLTSNPGGFLVRKSA
jgi:cephalosporin hydroxylase